MGAAVFVGGGVAEAAEVVEEIERFWRDGVRELEAVEELGLGFGGGGEQAVAGGGGLGEGFGELAELDEGGGGVGGEVVLCPDGERQGLGFEGGEEGEIGRIGFGHEGMYEFSGFWGYGGRFWGVGRGSTRINTDFLGGGIFE